MNDPLMEAVEQFMDAVLEKFGSLRTELMASIDARLKDAKGEKGDTVIGPIGLTGEPGRPGLVGPVGPVGSIGPPGNDGKGVDMSEVAGLVARAVAEIPRPKDGVDGKGVDPADVSRLVAAEVEKAVARIPVPRDGKDGARGQDADMEAIAAVAATEARKAVAALPIPRDGRDAEGKPGKDGKDGITIEQFHTAMKEVREKAVADTTQMLMETLKVEGREVKLAGVVIGRIATTIYQDVYKEGRAYEQGDMVTYASSVWHCNAAKTTDKPGEGNPAWTLAVKKGRDGRDTVKA